MELTFKETWTALHGMVFGAGFLLLFSGVFLAIWNLGSGDLTPQTVGPHIRRIAIAGWAMVILAWATVILGTYWIYPWYRAKPPAGAALAGYPKFLLLSWPRTADWHEFGMEWKEHIAWLTPILLTAVLVIVIRHGRLLVRHHNLRRFTLLLFTVAFFCASVAGVFER